MINTNTPATKRSRPVGAARAPHPCKKRSFLYVAKENAFIILIPLAVVVVLAFAGLLDEDAAQADEQHYCEMVKLHKETGKGWPDYKGIYAEVCGR